MDGNLLILSSLTSTKSRELAIVNCAIKSLAHCRQRNNMEIASDGSSALHAFRKRANIGVA